MTGMPNFLSEFINDGGEIYSSLITQGNVLAEFLTRLADLKKEHSILLEKKNDLRQVTVSFFENEVLSTQRFKLGENPFFILSILVFHLENFDEVTPHQIFSSVMPILIKKKKFSIANLRVTIQEFNKLMEQKQIPLRIKSQRTKGYYLEKDNLTISLCGFCKKAVSQAFWESYSGSNKGTLLENGSFLLETKKDFLNSLKNVLEKKFSNLVVYSKEVSLLSLPTTTGISKEIKENFLKQLENGVQYTEIISKHSLTKFLKKNSKDKKTILNEITRLLKKENYSFFIIENELPFSFYFFESNLGFMPEEELTSTLVLLGKQQNSLIKKLKTSIFLMEKIDSLTKLNRDDYIKKIQEELEKL